MPLQYQFPQDSAFPQVSSWPVVTSCRVCPELDNCAPCLLHPFEPDMVRAGTWSKIHPGRRSHLTIRPLAVLSKLLQSCLQVVPKLSSSCTLTPDQTTIGSCLQISKLSPTCCLLQETSTKANVYTWPSDQWQASPTPHLNLGPRGQQQQLGLPLAW